MLSFLLCPQAKLIHVLIKCRSLSGVLLIIQQAIAVKQH